MSHMWQSVEGSSRKRVNIKYCFPPHDAPIFHAMQQNHISPVFVGAVVTNIKYCGCKEWKNKKGNFTSIVYVHFTAVQLCEWQCNSILQHTAVWCELFQFSALNSELKYSAALRKTIYHRVVRHSVNQNNAMQLNSVQCCAVLGWVDNS